MHNYWEKKLLVKKLFRTQGTRDIRHAKLWRCNSFSYFMNLKNGLLKLKSPNLLKNVLNVKSDTNICFSMRGKTAYKSRCVTQGKSDIRNCENACLFRLLLLSFSSKTAYIINFLIV